MNLNEDQDRTSYMSDFVHELHTATVNRSSYNKFDVIVAAGITLALLIDGTIFDARLRELSFKES